MSVIVDDHLEGVVFPGCRGRFARLVKHGNGVGKSWSRLWLSLGRRSMNESWIFLLLPIKEGIVEVIQQEVDEVVKVICKERVSERIVERIVFRRVSLGASDPRRKSRMLRSSPRLKSTSKNAIEPPQMVEEVLEVVQILLQERMSERPVELIMDVPVPQMLEESQSG